MLYNDIKIFAKENVGALINMKIKSISVVNYRNIDGNSMVLHPESNYLIGENNLGKSNFLFLEIQNGGVIILYKSWEWFGEIVFVSQNRYRNDVLSILERCERNGDRND